MTARALASLGAIVLAGMLSPAAHGRQPAGQPSSPPNIVFILADDLGYGELGVYGQKKIRTPRLDRMAAEGMRFTQFYSGSPVCAPSRATLLTGRHTGHALVRDNYELGGFADHEERGQLALPPDTPTLARWLKAHGYTTAMIGKWGLGGPGSTGVPTRQGFDSFFGYLDQKQAHNFYPTHLWKNETWFPLRNPYFSPHQTFAGDPKDPAAFAKYSGTDYAIDAMTAEATRFLEAKRDGPFFLYFAPTLPHLALQVPQKPLSAYAGAFPETPYLGDRQYLPHRTPRAAYAAMISYLDEQVGRILDTLQRTGLDRRTVVFFTSDNGATWDVGGVDPKFFDSHGGLRGHKGQLYEGGIRVPMIARWPGQIRAGAVSDHVGANWDMWATFAELAGAPLNEQTDGLSIVPTLLGRSGQRRHDALYWEYHSSGSSQAVRMENWKGVRTNVLKNPGAAIELYDLARDPGETRDVAADHPEVLQRVERVMRQRTKSTIERWNF